MKIFERPDEAIAALRRAAASDRDRSLAVRKQHASDLLDYLEILESEFLGNMYQQRTIITTEELEDILKRSGDI